MYQQQHQHQIIIIKQHPVVVVVEMKIVAAKDVVQVHMIDIHLVKNIEDMEEHHLIIETENMIEIDILDLLLLEDLEDPGLDHLKEDLEVGHHHHLFIEEADLDHLLDIETEETEVGLDLETEKEIEIDYMMPRNDQLIAKKIAAKQKQFPLKHLVLHLLQQLLLLVINLLPLQT